MRVTYSIKAEGQDLDIEVNDDLPIFLQDLEVAIRTRHPEANQNKHLIVIIVDGVLNGLASDEEEIALGELVEKMS